MKTMSILVTVLAATLVTAPALAGGGADAGAGNAGGGLNAPAGNAVTGAQPRLGQAPAVAAGDAVANPALGGQPPARDPGTQGAMAEVDGTVRLIDVQSRRLMLDNGKTYTFADNLQMPAMKGGEKVKLTLDTTKRDVIVRISTTN